MRIMGKRFVAFLAAVMMTLVIFPAPNSSYAATPVPQTIRVGLYFTDPSAYNSTAAASFTVSAAAGLSIGYFKDNNFVELYNEATADILTVRRDDAGPYHIKMSADLPDLASVNALVQAMREKGIEAYAAFADAWQVWVGMYPDAAGAQQAIDNTLKPVIGEAVYTIIEPSDNRIAVLSQTNQVLAMFGSSTSVLQIRPRPENNPYIFSINKKPYRGILEVRRYKTSDMTVINELPLHEYLYGNVPPEIGAGSHQEALKAQALVSKMYAINSMKKHGKLGFDVCSTTSCQVYSGYGVEKPACNQAIDGIKDKVITYEGKPARSIFYFAPGGGRTEDVENVWGSPQPYLKSVEDPYEPVFRWTKTMRASDVRAKVPNIGSIQGIDITKTSTAGRATELVIRGEDDKAAKYTLERCRTIFSLSSQMYNITTDADIQISAQTGVQRKTQLGGHYVASAAGTKLLTASNNKVYVVGAEGTAKTVALSPENYTFAGKGWGHAVGMSQEGARSMGKAGITYDKILEHYFQGVKVK